MSNPNTLTLADGRKMPRDKAHAFEAILSEHHNGEWGQHSVIAAMEDAHAHGLASARRLKKMEWRERPDTRGAWWDAVTPSLRFHVCFAGTDVNGENPCWEWIVSGKEIPCPDEGSADLKIGHTQNLAAAQAACESWREAFVLGELE